MFFKAESFKNLSQTWWKVKFLIEKKITKKLHWFKISSTNKEKLLDVILTTKIAPNHLIKKTKSYYTMSTFVLKR